MDFSRKRTEPAATVFDAERGRAAARHSGEETARASIWAADRSSDQHGLRARHKGRPSGGGGGGGGGGGSGSATPTFTVTNMINPPALGRVTPNGNWAGGTQLALQSPRFSFGAMVQISGGSAAEQAQWELGPTQTVRHSERYGHYQPNGRFHDKLNSVPLVDMPPSGGTIPWYSGNSRFNGGMAAAAMGDAPNVSFPWKKGTKSLVRTSGHDSFTAYILARRRTGGQTHIVKWCAWRVDWQSRCNATTKRATGLGRARITHRVASRGAPAPKLTGPRSMAQINAGWG